MFMMVQSKTGCCELCPYLRCYCFAHCEKRKYDSAVIIEDNCCSCNYAALRRLCRMHNMEVVYATYHVEIGETPFFVALDHEKRTIVISIRGTLSLQDVVTDLNAEADQLPTEPRHDDWLGHKGMIQAAEYIKKKLMGEAILIQAFNHSPEKGTQDYDLVLVGHSLGAGTAAILAILLKWEYPKLVCYAYSPPGGLLSMPVVEYTKQFITSVVLGKDVVPRIGLHQMEALRSDLINAIKRSQDPKWKIIMGGVFCCCPEDIKLDTSEDLGEKSGFRDFTSHPSDSSIALTVHQPLYPPGKIIHIVRNHPKKEDQKYETKWRKIVKKHDPVYQALWANNTDFDEVLISPVMVQDHMPDKVLDALEQLLVNTGPAKPQRRLSETERHQLLLPNTSSSECGTRTPPHRLVLETSFTDLHPENEDHIQDLNKQGVATLSWDYSKAVGVILDTECGSDKYKKEWSGVAPLASPETLSDVSSISSKGSHNKLNNGNRLSWGGGPAMEPIAQSPAVQRPASDALCAYREHGEKFKVFSDSKINVSDPVSSSDYHKVVTEVTVEINPQRHETSSPRPMDPSHLSLNIGTLTQEMKMGDAEHGHSGVDSTYASTSTEQTIEKLFTPPEPKRVTFDLYDSHSKQKITREESEDSMYNSGESFVPSYPEFSTQQEYGSHCYMNHPYSYATYSPLDSSSIEHSVSDIQLFTIAGRPAIEKSQEQHNVNQLRDLAPLHEEPIVTSSPHKSLRRNITIDINVLSPHSPQKIYRDPPTESSL